MVLHGAHHLPFTTLECLLRVLAQPPPAVEGGGRNRDRSSKWILKAKKPAHSNGCSY
ncbi:DNA excision repair protein ERCC 6 [Sesbania bispinosa]|nr:DNA excision repair protein ERCC 6 [Sesbania bispinosa]